MGESQVWHYNAAASKKQRS